MYELFLTTTLTRCILFCERSIFLWNLNQLSWNSGRWAAQPGVGIQLWGHFARHQRQRWWMVAGHIEWWGKKQCSKSSLKPEEVELFEVVEVISLIYTGSKIVAKWRGGWLGYCSFQAEVTGLTLRFFKTFTFSLFCSGSQTLQIWIFDPILKLATYPIRWERKMKMKNRKLVFGGQGGPHGRSSTSLDRWVAAKYNQGYFGIWPQWI